MTPRTRRRGTALALLIAGAGHAALAQELSKAEELCRRGTNGTAYRLAGAKLRCLHRCEQLARKGTIPPRDCTPPFAGDTAACVAAAGAASLVQKSCCVNDCPECYAGGECLEAATQRTLAIESQVDTLAALVYCDDSGSGDGSLAAEERCQDTIAKTLARFISRKAHCYAKCRLDEYRGLVPAGACTPGAVTDPRTSACIAKWEAKTTAAIDKRCSTAGGGDAPDCHGATTSAEWTARGEALVDVNQPGIFCGSPSAAFID